MEDFVLARRPSIVLNLKEYSEILILLYILKELSYTNLTSIGLLQKQNGFDKMDRSVHFLNFYVRAVYSIQ